MVTLDIDLGNQPELIPNMVKAFLEKNLDLLIACRTVIPRVTERFASRTIGRVVGVRDIYSNFRVRKRDLFKDFRPRLKEGFGAELIVYEWLDNYRIGEYVYEPPPRRRNPRIGGRLKANARIFSTTIKLLTYLLLTKPKR